MPFGIQKIIYKALTDSNIPRNSPKAEPFKLWLAKMENNIIGYVEENKKRIT